MNSVIFQKVDALVQQLGRAIEIDQLALDSKAHCCLAFDDKILVNMEVDEERESLLFYAFIGEVKGDLSGGYRHLLQKNTSEEIDYMTLSLNTMHNEQNVVLMDCLHEKVMDYPIFEKRLESFVDFAENCGQELEVFFEPPPQQQENNTDFPNI